MLLEDCARLADSVENVEPLAPRRDLRQPDNQSNGFEFLERPNIENTWSRTPRSFPGTKGRASSWTASAVKDCST